MSWCTRIVIAAAIVQCSQGVQLTRQSVDVAQLPEESQLPDVSQGAEENVTEKSSMCAGMDANGEIPVPAKGEPGYWEDFDFPPMPGETVVYFMRRADGPEANDAELTRTGREHLDQMSRKRDLVRNMIPAKQVYTSLQYAAIQTGLILFGGWETPELIPRGDLVEVSGYTKGPQNTAKNGYVEVCPGKPDDVTSGDWRKSDHYKDSVKAVKKWEKGPRSESDKPDFTGCYDIHNEYPNKELIGILHCNYKDVDSGTIGLSSGTIGLSPGRAKGACTSASPTQRANFDFEYNQTVSTCRQWDDKMCGGPSFRAKRVMKDVMSSCTADTSKSIVVISHFVALKFLAGETDQAIGLHCMLNSDVVKAAYDPVKKRWRQLGGRSAKPWSPPGHHGDIVEDPWRPKYTTTTTTSPISL